MKRLAPFKLIAILGGALLIGACHPIVHPGTPSKDDPAHVQKK